MTPTLDASLPPPPRAAAAPLRRGDPAPFLDGEPPHWVARGLSHLLIALFVAALVGVVVVRMPEAVSCSFVLLPARGADPLRAPRSGVLAEVRANDAATVATGEALFVIRSPDVGDRSAELRTLETALDGDAMHLANARREHDSRALDDAQEARKLDERIAFLAGAVDRQKYQLGLTRDLVDRYETAYRKGFSSWLEYVAHRMEANQAAQQLAQFEADAREADAARRQIDHRVAARDARYAEIQRDLGEGMEKARIRIAALRQELADSDSDELTVSAPCAGTVLRLAVKAPGAFVHQGDVLGEVACSGERLEAELMVPETGVARIKSGQSVKLLYDAFPYQRYGVKYGTVRWISPSGVDRSDGRRFRALADLDGDSVQVDSEPRPLVAGMGGTARVVVGRRSIISAAFAPLRELQEAFRDVPPRPAPHAPPQDAHAN